MLLHSFLRYFVLNMVQVPYLANVPDGIGGVVMNWHIDAASALKPMTTLRKAGIFDNGPFSADMTAGPDVDEFHDGKGLNLQDNTEARSWVQFLLRHGDEVGSHGGWIHNYFGKHLSDTNQDSFQQYLALNKETVEAASGRSLYDFGARRAHGPQAGMLAARASYLAGFAGTSHGADSFSERKFIGNQAFDIHGVCFQQFQRRPESAAARADDAYFINDNPRRVHFCRTMESRLQNQHTARMK